MRLGPSVRILGAVVLAAAVGWIGWCAFRPQGHDDAPAAAPADAGSRVRLPRRHIVVGIDDFGGAAAGLVANDGLTPGPRSIFKRQGLDVEIRLIRDARARRKAFDTADVDVMLLPLAEVAASMPRYRERGIELRIFQMAAWSRGHCGIVARSAYRSIESLAHARLATIRYGAAHHLVLSLLERSGVPPEGLAEARGNLVFAASGALAREMLEERKVDAVAVCEPHLARAAAARGVRTLVTTATATHLVADVLVARMEFLKANEEVLPRFIRAWLAGVRLVRAEPERAAEVVATALDEGEAETREVLRKIKPASFADNRVFFGLDGAGRAPELRLFAEASRFWQDEGRVRTPVSPADSRWLKALAAVARDQGYAREQVVERFGLTRAAPAGAAALLTRSVDVRFSAGAAQLDPAAAARLDELADALAVFQNAYLRVEGGAATPALAKRRAAAVVDYLVEHHGIARTRFVAGPGGGPAGEEGRIEVGVIANR